MVFFYHQPFFLKLYSKSIRNQFENNSKQFETTWESSEFQVVAPPIAPLFQFHVKMKMLWYAFHLCSECDVDTEQFFCFVLHLGYYSTWKCSSMMFPYTHWNVTCIAFEYNELAVFKKPFFYCRKLNTLEHLWMEKS